MAIERRYNLDSSVTSCLKVFATAFAKITGKNCIASPKSSSVGLPPSCSPWLPVMLPRGYNGAEDLWLSHPLTRYTPDKRKRGVRHRKGICPTRSPLPCHTGGTRRKHIKNP